ncbi:uncharacterized protein LOC116138702 [Pistacia vera]|uniref:uncharacterized protein LOC116138702 n=1 Tax=Pistacia vera TaxID=55513 RepID=UPI001263C5A6|nr:uncharacterized protein LOC116138702 [Pistacia vera]
MAIPEWNGYILDEPIIEAPKLESAQEARDAYRKYLDGADIVQCILLASLTPDMQEQHENMDVYSIVTHLKELFQKRAKHECYKVSKALYRCRMSEGNTASPHVVKIIGYIKKLEKLGFAMDAELPIDLVMQSLPASFSKFIMNFNMNSMEKSLLELLNMLKTTEKDMKKFKPGMLVDAAPWKGRVNRAKKKPRATLNLSLKPKMPLNLLEA